MNKSIQQKSVSGHIYALNLQLHGLDTYLSYFILFLLPICSALLVLSVSYPNLVFCLLLLASLPWGAFKIPYLYPLASWLQVFTCFVRVFHRQIYYFLKMFFLCIISGVCWVSSLQLLILVVRNLKKVIFFCLCWSKQKKKKIPLMAVSKDWNIIVIWEWVLLTWASKQLALATTQNNLATRNALVVHFCVWKERKYTVTHVLRLHVPVL